MLEQGDSGTVSIREHWQDLASAVRRAYTQFLALPTAVIGAFLLLAVVALWLDTTTPGWIRPLRRLMAAHVLSSAQATASLLRVIAGGLITVTSISFSLLPLAMQQAAAALTAQVFDQFLRRRLNQLYFGFFVGLTLYILIILASVSDPFNPIVAGTLALLLTAVALYLLIALVYSTINQMTPQVIVQAIHDRALQARRHQQPLLARTRRRPQLDAPICLPVETPRDGFITWLRLDRLAHAIEQCVGDVEVCFVSPIGTYVATGDTIGEVRAALAGEARDLVKAAQWALVIDRQRDTWRDPLAGINELAAIGWTSISSAKSNPAAGRLAIRAIRDLAARWAGNDPGPRADRVLPVVLPDTLWGRVLSTFESYAVAATESQQHQTLAEVVRTLALLLPRLPVGVRTQVAHLVLRLTPALCREVLTAELDAALSTLERALRACEEQATAATLAAAQAQLRAAAGTLSGPGTST